MLLLLSYKITQGDSLEICHIISLFSKSSNDSHLTQYLKRRVLFWPIWPSVIPTVEHSIPSNKNALPLSSEQFPYLLQVFTQKLPPQ